MTETIMTSFYGFYNEREYRALVKLDNSTGDSTIYSAKYTDDGQSVPEFDPIHPDHQKFIEAFEQEVELDWSGG